MAAAGTEAEDFNLFQAVRAVGEEFCPALNLTIPVGKDSLSMKTVWQDKEGQTSVTSPVSLIASAFAPVSDIRVTLTPQLNPSLKSSLIFIDLSSGKNRLGGSALAQAYSLSGGKSPDADDPNRILKFFDCIQELNRNKLIMAYHDRSDGGLLATLLEMAFAGRCGLEADISVMPGAPLEKLFTEELGGIIQVDDKDLVEIKLVLNKYLKGCFYEIGRPVKERRIKISDSDTPIINQSAAELEKIWAKTSYQIQSIRDDKQCADQEYALIDNDQDPGINPHISFDLKKQSFKKRPRVAVLREQGVNGQNEMAAALTMAGFEAVDVHMSALQSKKISLDGFQGLAASGGFSYGDVLGAGLGQAKNILFEPHLRQQFEAFFSREDTFSLGVCNGCQVLSALKDIIPGAGHWPRFMQNRSEQYEARLISVKVNETPSIFLKDMAGSVLPVVVSHGEGQAVFESEEILKKSLQAKTVPLQYVDNRHEVTETYPLNPNGSQRGVASLTSDDGRVLIMMPHPERTFLTYQNSWHPADWQEYGPWLRMFQNARVWVESR